MAVTRKIVDRLEVIQKYFLADQGRREERQRVRDIIDSETERNRYREEKERESELKVNEQEGDGVAIKIQYNSSFFSRSVLAQRFTSILPRSSLPCYSLRFPYTRTISRYNI